jgi:hypothetical protein
MPLRDHFRPPLDDITSWDGFYGCWPAVIVKGLFHTLPPSYSAGPRIHLGSLAGTNLGDQDEYQVRVYDANRPRRLVAAIEIVSPANKDRLERRRVFVAKCLALLWERVSVTIIDLVTTQQFNLYGDLLEAMGQADPSLAPEPPPLYASACRCTSQGGRDHLQVWHYPLALGQPLPTLPLWLADDLAVPLELETSYEETCRILRIA